MDSSDQSPSQPMLGGPTARRAYAERLQRLEGAHWKQVLDVQAPYRRHIRRLQLGRTLDIGCGIGRNLAALAEGSVGVDHNADAVAAARDRGFEAFTSEDFRAKHSHSEQFDSMLVAHVLEHLDESTADGLLEEYLSFVRPGGRVVLITPQEAGFITDETHVRFVDSNLLVNHALRAALNITRQYSFPFPRQVGKLFPYNEFVLLATRG